jgi:hypothetical protein
VVQVRERTTLERPPVPIEERPSRLFRWMAWLFGIIVVAGVAGLTWWFLSESEPEPTAIDSDILVEDFTGVDEFIAEQTAAARVAPTPLQEDFTGVDEFIAGQTAARVAPTPLQEDFSGLE